MFDGTYPLSSQFRERLANDINTVLARLDGLVRETMQGAFERKSADEISPSGLLWFVDGTGSEGVRVFAPPLPYLLASIEADDNTCDNIWFMLLLLGCGVAQTPYEPDDSLGDLAE
jgi:hypothetical protein